MGQPSHPCELVDRAIQDNTQSVSVPSALTGHPICKSCTTTPRKTKQTNRLRIVFSFPYLGLRNISIRKTVDNNMRQHFSLVTRLQLLPVKSYSRPEAGSPLINYFSHVLNLNNKQTASVRFAKVGGSTLSPRGPYDAENRRTFNVEPYVSTTTLAL